ncbi:DegV family protein [Halobacillus halophilus]|uniref:DegV family protein n=1 Tax=Halobacillus halophilus TaxID=1570 RepID=UPI001CD526C4|nr:DegV family protein [Halobacillus halophilus]MCA1011406.1 DegV family protein [Halobacillus halophilus]
MRRIIISTESGADIPDDLVEKYNIQVVPMHIIMGGKDYLDGSLPVQDIYDYYERTKKIPSTTSTNVHEYQEFFTNIRKKFPNCTIIHIGYTSKASSSFQHAVMAAEEFENIFLIDALNVTGGLAAIVLDAARVLEKEPGIEPERFVERIEKIVPKSRLAFIPGSLEFLKAGGRVSNMASLIGTLLRIKPCIELKDGKLMSTKKYRGKMGRATENLLKDYLTEFNIDRKQIYFIYSIGLDERIKHRMEEVAKANDFQNIRWIQAGGMISTHSGAGGFGVAGLEK